MAIHPGDILAGYRVTRLLGRGGMGEVWAATADPGPGGVRRDVAVKVLLARAAMKPDLVRRFEREARIASAIKSPFVCQFVELGATDDGSHLLVFEQLVGESLADRLKREQYLPFSEVGPIIDDVLQGLSAAHEAGVIHRDLKPGNIFLEQVSAPPDDPYVPPGGGFGLGATPDTEPPARHERAKILDFGISKIAHPDKGEPTLTAFDATLGSFAYMAPEQVRGAARADLRADIYAVGAVVFRALSGRRPFEGTTAAVLVAMKLDRQAPSLAEATGEQWPAGIERFLERALERRRENRFSSAVEALAVWRSIQPGNIRMRPKGQPQQRTATLTEAPIEPYVPLTGEMPAYRASSPDLSPVIAPPHVPGPPAAYRPVTEEMPVPHYRPVTEEMPAYRPSTEEMSPVRLPKPVVIPSPGPPRHPLGSSPALPRPPLPSTPGPPPRPPMPSYQVVEDNPTEVDGPPEMTADGETTRRRKTGRPQGA